MSLVSGHVKLSALLDGTTYSGRLLNYGTYPLVQFYTQGSDSYAPDFSKLTETERPLIVPIITDLMTGAVVVPQTAQGTWSYNGIALTFDGSGKSTNEGMEGVFFRTTKSVSYNGQSYTLPALRVDGNLVIIGNYDNDRISYSCTVEAGGHTVGIGPLDIEATITEGSKNAYHVSIRTAEDSDTSIGSETDKVALEAVVLNGGTLITDFSGYRFEWKSQGAGADGEDVTFPDTDNTIELGADDINRYALISAELFDGKGTSLGIGFIEVSDDIDTYYIVFETTGTTGGNQLRKGETAVLTPALYQKGSTSKVTGKVSEWTFTTYDDQGNDIAIGNNAGNTVKGATLSVTYADVAKAGYGLTVIATGDVQ